MSTKDSKTEQPCTIHGVLNCKKYEFGRNYYYFPKQIAVWRGGQPCILRIKRKIEDNIYSRDCYESTTKTHNSLHYTNLRPATEEEIKLLGRKQVLFIV